MILMYHSLNYIVVLDRLPISDANDQDSSEKKAVCHDILINFLQDSNRTEKKALRHRGT